MKLSVKATQADKLPKSCLIVGVYDNGDLTPTAKLLDKACKGSITKLIKQGAFQGKLGQTLPLHFAANEFDLILLAGCGKANAVSAPAFRKIMVSSIKAVAGAKVQHAVCYLTDVEVSGKSLAWKVKQIAEAAWEGLYRFDMFKSEREAAHTIKELVVNVADAKAAKGCEEALKQGQAIANGVILTKNLANTPSNICTPSFLAAQAKDLGKTHPALKVKVLEEAEMKKLGMGALLAVSQGSAEDAKFIVIEYSGGKRQTAPTVLVGKGITFDTGGNSLKPADSMVGMKYDMCGAATVLGTMKAIAELKLPVHVAGIVAAVENMPGGTAYKPEDILTSMSGQTIEVISTDAEGRLILADALTYAEKYKPAAVIDIATLTGAAVIALGFHTTALLTNHQPLADDLLKAGTESNDRAWQLPMFDEYQEQIKSPFADMANTGGRSAGTITAACFLSRFAKKFNWAHLDVAGTAAMMSGTSERMATGRPVPMLVQYLIDKAG
jgi:leucyl aminopeptidase